MTVYFFYEEDFSVAKSNLWQFFLSFSVTIWGALFSWTSWIRVGVVSDVCIAWTTDFISRSKVCHLLPSFAGLLHRMIVVVFAAQLINSITISPVIQRNTLYETMKQVWQNQSTWWICLLKQWTSNKIYFQICRLRFWCSRKAFVQFLGYHINKSKLEENLAFTKIMWLSMEHVN